jgi:5-methylcytosine-specific restriction enzyme A
MRHFLQYLKVEQADTLQGTPLNHIASAQYKKIDLANGDILWIVSIRNYRLRLLGRLVVNHVVGQREAERLLHQENLYEAPFHAIAEHNSLHEVHEQDIQDLAARLRFNSPNDRLVLATPQHVDGKQIQSIRELTFASVELLKERLDERFDKIRNPPWTRDEVILALDVYFRHNPSHMSQDDPSVIDLSRTLIALAKRLGKQAEPSFRNANGVYMKLCNFLHLDPDYPGEGLSSVSAIDRQVWNEYSARRDELRTLAESIRSSIRSPEMPLHETLGSLEESEFPEGALKYRQHVSRERNRDLVRKAKQRYKQKHGKIDCEICGFDFYEVYGEMGEDFIECHHTLAVSELGPNSKTKIDDVVLLCPNCHRIVHRRRPWLRVNELRTILRTKRTDLNITQHQPSAR